MIVGVLGGAFDPVHRGHVEIGQLLLEKKMVDVVLFTPTWAPPHKSRTGASFQHRLKMLEMALHESREFQVSAIESQLPSPSYTINTIEYLKNHIYPKERVRFVIGSDAFLEICSWKEYGKLLRETELIVVQRKGCVTEETKKFIEEIGYNLENGDYTFRNGGAGLYLIEDYPINVSSSFVKQQIYKARKAADYLPLHPKVLNYINENNLYGFEESDEN